MSNLDRRLFLEALSATFLPAMLRAGASHGPVSPGSRILVIYATRCGSTREIATVLTDDLKARGFDAELRSVANAAPIDACRAVVVGSAVRAGNWLPEAVKFVQSHQPELTGLPTAFFTVHMMNTGADEKSSRAREGYTARVRALVRPEVEAFFTGSMKMSQLSFSERLICKVFGAHDADLRNWPAIHSWGARLFADG